MPPPAERRRPVVRRGLDGRSRRWLPSLGCGLAGLIGAAATEPLVVGSATRGPGLGPYAGVCLGNCFECHSLLESLPRWPRPAAFLSHTDPSRFSLAELEAFVTAPEVCDITELFPVSADREIWSLAAMKGGSEQLHFPGARQQVKAATRKCSAMMSLSAGALAEARRSALSCAAGAPLDGGLRCRSEAARRTAAELLRRWQGAFGSSAAAHADPAGGEWSEASDRFVVEVDFGGAGNETGDLLQAFSARVERLLLGSGALHPPAAGGAAAASALGWLAELPLGGRASGVLLGVSMELAKAARLMIEHVRTIWGTKNLIEDISSMYPQIREQLPTFRMHAGRYGRHWDLLEWLMHGLVAGSRNTTEEEASREAPLRMVELGVACGPIGFHMLARFPSLRYFGADPTIRDVVYQAYSPYSDRATLHAKTSEELHEILEGSEPLDFVFIDGPHTYKNVRNDIEMWAPRMRPGGIIAGHDFTCAHPPLLWAVLEYRMNSGGGAINLGMDGVWWWRAE